MFLSNELGSKIIYVDIKALSANVNRDVGLEMLHRLEHSGSCVKTRNSMILKEDHLYLGTQIDAYANYSLNRFDKVARL